MTLSENTFLGAVGRSEPRALGVGYYGCGGSRLCCISREVWIGHCDWQAKERHDVVMVVVVAVRVIVVVVIEVVVVVLLLAVTLRPLQTMRCWPWDRGRMAAWPDSARSIGKVTGWVEQCRKRQAGKAGKAQACPSKKESDAMALDWRVGTQERKSTPHRSWSHPAESGKWKMGHRTVRIRFAGQVEI